MVSIKEWLWHRLLLRLAQLTQIESRHSLLFFFDRPWNSQILVAFTLIRRGGDQWVLWPTPAPPGLLNPDSSIIKAYELFYWRHSFWTRLISFRENRVVLLTRIWAKALLSRLVVVLKCRLGLGLLAFSFWPGCIEGVLICLHVKLIWLLLLGEWFGSIFLALLA